MSNQIKPVLAVSCLLYFTLFVWIFPISASAATIEIAQDSRTHETAMGITVEGDIEAGDTYRLLSKLIEFNATHSPDVARIVFLRSKGGDVAEAMKMGTLIRQLRLETDAPIETDGQIFDRATLADKRNSICASACFLVYAGGVERDGNFLALHRPYFPKATAEKLSDVQYEEAEKREMNKIRHYLQDMEVDQFFIDKMMSYNSQDSYVVALWETTEHHLDQIVPSIEEAVLSKCTVLTSQEGHLVDSINKTTPEGRQLVEQLLAKDDAGHECEEKALDDIRQAAFRREINSLQEQKQ